MTVATFRGRAVATTTAGAEPGVVWLADTTASVLSKDAVRRLNATGDVPDPGDQCLVRLTPGDAADWTLTLTVGATVHEFRFTPQPEELDERGRFTAAFVFVHGPRPLRPGLSFPLIHIVDVTQPGTPGHAPHVDLDAFGATARVTLGAAPARSRQVTGAGTIVVHVTQDGLPVDGAKVTLIGEPVDPQEFTQHTLEGVVQFDQVPPSERYVVGAGKQLRWGQRGVSLSAGETQTVRIELDQRVGSRTP